MLAFTDIEKQKALEIIRAIREALPKDNSGGGQSQQNTSPMTANPATAPSSTTRGTNEKDAQNLVFMHSFVEGC